MKRANGEFVGTTDELERNVTMQVPAGEAPAVAGIP